MFKKKKKDKIKPEEKATMPEIERSEEIAIKEPKKFKEAEQTQEVLIPDLMILEELRAWRNLFQYTTASILEELNKIRKIMEELKDEDGD